MKVIFKFDASDEARKAIFKMFNPAHKGNRMATRKQMTELLETFVAGWEPERASFDLRAMRVSAGEATARTAEPAQQADERTSYQRGWDNAGRVLGKGETK